MCQLLETIKCKNGKLYNLEFHQTRFETARKSLFSCSDKINLSKVIQVPKEFQIGIFRCRVIYSETIIKIEFIPHQFRKIKSLKLIEENEIDYLFKYSDRKKLNSLFEKRGDCDDILIVKNGCITDSLTANIIIFDGKKWWTPDTPLLHGTQRAKLINEGKIKVCSISKSDISKYSKVGLINAMWNFDNMPVISIEKIH
ncbi:MAG: hypothetical protein GQ525_13020 [Draconibacterium sp.]|nr:hypothetical protein [Draconibacterium sp.]